MTKFLFTTKKSLKLLCLMRNLQKYGLHLIPATQLSTIDAAELFSYDIYRRNKSKVMLKFSPDCGIGIRYFMKSECEPLDPMTMTTKELETALVQLSTRKKYKQLLELICECKRIQRIISDSTIRELFCDLSINGKVNQVIALQEYCSVVSSGLYERNGQFLHYLAKAQCMKGNAEKGLSILKEAYDMYVNFRCVYKTVFNELIKDSVSNRSEATLVVFKKYTLYFSETYKEHYPLLCLWYICWSSSWFSDQMLADELLASSKALREVIGEKSRQFSTAALHSDYNEDALVRLMQTFLKYKMMDSYFVAIQVLFSYKLKQRDLRACREIIINCQQLGLTLPSSQQGRYIKMLIQGQKTADFKLKF